MAKIDYEGHQEILQIIRDGHYLALATHDMKVFVLRTADGIGTHKDGEDFEAWLDNLIGGRPVAGYGSRATQPTLQYAEVTMEPAPVMDVIESVRRSPLTMEDRARYLERLRRTRPHNDTYYVVGGPMDNDIWKSDTGVPLANGDKVNFRHIVKIGEQVNLVYRVAGATINYVTETPTDKPKRHKKRSSR